MALYQLITGKTTRRFASYARGQEQVWRAIVSAGLDEKAPAKAQRLANRLRDIMQDGQPRHIEALTLALALDASPGQIRGALDGLRAQGFVTLNVATDLQARRADDRPQGQGWPARGRVMRSAIITAVITIILAHLALLGVVAWELHELNREQDSHWRLLYRIEDNTCDALRNPRDACHTPPW